MEAATLRTRKAKRTVGREALFTQWREEARALGFDLNRVNVRGSETQPIQRVAGIERPVQSPAAVQSSSQIGAAANQLAASARVLDQHAAMPGVAINLRQREQDDARGR